MTTGTETGRWAAPTETERALYDAQARGDTDAQLDALSRTRLYVLLPRLDADTPDFITPPRSQRDPATGRTCFPVLTPGLLPPWHPDWVFRRTTLAELAHGWPDNGWWLGVNLDTPIASAVPARPGHRKAWLAAVERTGGPQPGRLITHGAGPL
ncbi:MAG TPA: hypothetical protein VFH94_08705, partial [Streptomyces sp.]|nr:hypothetical protein [Streptomyces sp.]